jgi:hypothetical protein
VERVFRRTGSFNSSRYYGSGLGDFEESCNGARIGNIGSKNAGASSTSSSEDVP